MINDEARKMIKSKCIGKEEGKNIKQVIHVEKILNGIEKYIGSKENNCEKLKLELALLDKMDGLVNMENKNC